MILVRRNRGDRRLLSFLFLLLFVIHFSAALTFVNIIGTMARRDHRYFGFRNGTTSDRLVRRWQDQHVVLTNHFVVCYSFQIFVVVIRIVPVWRLVGSDVTWLEIFAFVTTG